MLGRRFYLHHSHSTIYPNIYAMLVGTSGTRKSTAIKMIRKMIQDAGYETIAADKSTKEKFILDLAGEPDVDPTEKTSKFSRRYNDQEFLESNLWGEDDSASKADSEIFIMADEFNDFFGNGNVEFISLLGTLWDYSGIYRNRIKNGKSVNIHNPTVSILGGNTPTGISLAFPAEILGQGFFSRLLFIYGEPNGKLIPFPKRPDPAETAIQIKLLQLIRSSSIGEATLTPTAESFLIKIYLAKLGVSDPRFSSYSTRRFNHLIKLCIICAACRLSKSIEECDVLYANTILAHAEYFMPKALGEFGKAKLSGVSHKVISLIESEVRAFSFKEIFRAVSSDLDSPSELMKLLTNLITADKIQAVGQAKFLAKRLLISDDIDNLVDWSLLTDEERNMKK